MKRLPVPKDVSPRVFSLLSACPLAASTKLHARRLQIARTIAIASDNYNQLALAKRDPRGCNSQLALRSRMAMLNSAWRTSSSFAHLPCSCSSSSFASESHFTLLDVAEGTTLAFLCACSRVLLRCLLAAFQLGVCFFPFLFDGRHFHRRALCWLSAICSVLHVVF